VFSDDEHKPVIKIKAKPVEWIERILFKHK
jgi:hypothetical protein